MIIILSAVIFVFGCVIVYLIWKNVGINDEVLLLKTDNTQLEKKLERTKTRRDDHQIECKNLQHSNQDLRTVMLEVKKERDNALWLLEAWLENDLKTHKAPTRVMTEIGREGVYYVFQWDPPENNVPTAESEEECPIEISVVPTTLQVASP